MAAESFFFGAITRVDQHRAPQNFTAFRYHAGVDQRTIRLPREQRAPSDVPSSIRAPEASQLTTGSVRTAERSACRVEHTTSETARRSILREQRPGSPLASAPSARARPPLRSPHRTPGLRPPLRGAVWTRVRMLVIRSHPTNPAQHTRGGKEPVPSAPGQSLWQCNVHFGNTYIVGGIRATASGWLPRQRLSLRWSVRHDTAVCSRVCTVGPRGLSPVI